VPWTDRRDAQAEAPSDQANLDEDAAPEEPVASDPEDAAPEEDAGVAAEGPDGSAKARGSAE
jgi:hypothetical protein